MLKKKCNVISPQVLADGTVRLRADLFQDEDSSDDLKTLYELRAEETVVYVVPLEVSILLDKLLKEIESTH